MTTRLPDLRVRLASTQVASRNAREDLRVAQARAEARAIEAAGGEKTLGGNAESRGRALLLAVAQDSDYQDALAMVRSLEATSAILEAELEGERDRRREREWSVRLRLADALDRRGVPTESDDQADDTAFEDGADAFSSSEVARGLREMVSDRNRHLTVAASACESAPDDSPF